jgi:hypothetical protein
MSNKNTKHTDSCTAAKKKHKENAESLCNKLAILHKLSFELGKSKLQTVRVTLNEKNYDVSKSSLKTLISDMSTQIRNLGEFVTEAGTVNKRQSTNTTGFLNPIKVTDTLVEFLSDPDVKFGPAYDKVVIGQTTDKKGNIQDEIEYRKCDDDLKNILRNTIVWDDNEGTSKITTSGIITAIFNEWVYVNNLNDPNNKSLIIPDKVFKKYFTKDGVVLAQTEDGDITSVNLIKKLQDRYDAKALTQKLKNPESVNKDGLRRDKRIGKNGDAVTYIHRPTEDRLTTSSFTSITHCLNEGMSSEEQKRIRNNEEIMNNLNRIQRIVSATREWNRIQSSKKQEVPVVEPEPVKTVQPEKKTGRGGRGGRGGKK